MPVIDHPVHESTRITSDFRYGCHNRPPFRDGYWAHPWSADGPKFVKYRMSMPCQYDLSANDNACEGCVRRNP